MVLSIQGMNQPWLSSQLGGKVFGLGGDSSAGEATNGANPGGFADKSIVGDRNGS